MTLAITRSTEDLLFRKQQAVQTFSSRPVSEEQLRAIWDLVRHGPTAFNQQPLRGVIVTSPEEKSRLSQIMLGANADKVLSAPASIVVLADSSFHLDLPRLFPSFPAAKDVLFADVHTREQSALQSATLQLGYLIIGIRAAGLAAAPMTGFDPEALAQGFAADNQTPIAVVSLGYPADAYGPAKPRLEFDDVFQQV